MARLFLAVLCIQITSGLRNTGNYDEMQSQTNQVFPGTPLSNTTTPIEENGPANLEHSHLCSNSPVTCALALVFSGVLIAGTIIGNMFVIAAICLGKSLQNVANYLIVSLACADLMVAIMVMPIAAYNEVSYKW